MICGSGDVMRDVISGGLVCGGVLMWNVFDSGMWN